MTIVQVLNFLDENIKEVEFLRDHNMEPGIVKSMDTSAKSLILFKKLLIEKAKEEDSLSEVV
jgi:hypothetical protein